MNFDGVVSDIKKMIGMELQSIRPGSSITLLEVDDERGSVLLKTAKGAKRSRPISELKSIWEEMNHSPAIHVDEVLHGSGTSRNQPETIFANLPYVEWLRITNKKHIAYVGKATHPYGILKQMNAVDAAALSTSFAEKSTKKRFTAVVACKNIAEGINAMNQECPGTVKAMNQEAYSYQIGNDSILFLLADKELDEGTYTIIERANYTDTTSRRVQILNEYYRAINLGAAKVLIRQQNGMNKSEKEDNE